MVNKLAKRKVRTHALQWGTELRKYRNQAGKTQSWLAAQLHCSNGLVCGFEKGTHWPGKEMADRLDTLVQAHGALSTSWLRLSSRRAYPEWMGERIKAEPRSSLIREFEPVVVSGLLQTPDYARTLLKAGNAFSAPQAIDHMVEGRLRRQAIWDGPNPPRMVVVFNEAALTVPTGGPTVMSHQLSRLISMVEADTLRLHVVPFDTEQPPFTTSFSLLSFPEQADVLYVEDAVSGRMVTDDDDVRRMDRVFSELLGVALSPEKSLKALYEYRRTFDHGT